MKSRISWNRVQETLWTGTWRLNKLPYTASIVEFEAKTGEQRFHWKVDYRVSGKDEIDYFLVDTGVESSLADAMSRCYEVKDYVGSGGTKVSGAFRRKRASGRSDPNGGARPNRVQVQESRV